MNKPSVDDKMYQMRKNTLQVTHESDMRPV